MQRGRGARRWEPFFHLCRVVGLETTSDPEELRKDRRYVRTKMPDGPPVPIVRDREWRALGRPS